MTAHPALTNETVLIVDDTPDNLAVLSDMLSEYGYRVLVATDGISAIEQIKHLQPDICYPIQQLKYFMIIFR